MENFGKKNQSHVIRRYLSKTGEDVRAFSKRVGVTERTVYRIMSGKSSRYSTAVKLSSASEGFFSPVDIFTHQNHPVINEEIEKSTSLKHNGVQYE